MNKYQEALDWVSEGNDSCGTEWELLQELVDKEIPLIPNKQYEIDWGIGNVGECSNCKNLVNYQNSYCDKCGQRVLWED